MGAKQKGVEVIPWGARGTEIKMYATHYYNMRRVVLLMMLLPLVVSCGKESKEEASEQTYAMLEQVAELSAGGNKQAALELADSFHRRQ